MGGGGANQDEGLDRTSDQVRGWRNSQAYERAIMWHTYIHVCVSLM